MPTFSKSVAVLIETGDSWGRNVVEAIARFARDVRWSLVISPRDNRGLMRLPRNWKGDGAIVMLRDAAMARHLKAARIPVVDVDVLMLSEDWVGRVNTNDQLRIKLAFDHFRSKNFRHFAYFAPRVNRYPNQRSQLFREAVEKAGLTCAGYEDPDGRAKDLNWSLDYGSVSRWLRQLPMPLAVFAPDPVPARQLTEICQWAGIHIPDQVSVLAGDTDDLLCSVASPPISSIELDCYRIGKEACKMLTRMMAGRSLSRRVKKIPPLRVISRHSTEILAVDDQLIGDVLRFIRSRACDGIQVSDILRSFPISRRTLEQRFRQTLGRTLAQEIRRVRLEHARQLLVETKMSVTAVATACSFSSGAELAHAFRKYLGIKPTALRRR